MAPDLVLANCDIAIVGGGVGGVSLAYFLAKEGADVCVIERGDLFGAASGANAGTLHEQTIFSADRDRTSYERQASVIPILHEGARLWEELSRDWGVDLGVSRTGGLLVAEADFDVRRLREKVEIENRAGGSARLIEQDELRAIAPYVSPLAVRAVFAANEGKVDVLAAVSALAQQIRKLPVRLLLHTDVRDFERTPQGIRIQTRSGTVMAQRLVLAGGAWNEGLVKRLGWSLPLRVRAIQCAATEKAPRFILHTLQHATRRITLKQNHHGSVVLGGGWPAHSFDADQAPSVIPSSVMGVVAIARHIVPQTGGLRLLRAWASYISTPIDEMPVIGAIPGARNCFVLQTNLLGITSAHALAKSLADLILFSRRGFAADLANPERRSLQPPADQPAYVAATDEFTRGPDAVRQDRDVQWSHP